jgi:hypothetical protein
LRVPVSRFLLITAFVGAALAAPPAPARADALPPDIDMRAPLDVHVTAGRGGRAFVAFESRIVNRGPGPLKILGQRSTSVPGARMAATQVLLDTSSVTTGRVARAVPVGPLQFSPAGGHDHWHYLHFEDYMLLSVPNLDFVAPTRKTGFCLTGLNLSYNCGRGQPKLTRIGDPAEAALGAGPFPDTQAMGEAAVQERDFGNRSFEDFYEPTVEGQDVEITRVPDGRYCLSFVADPDGRLVEADTSNNGASELIDLTTTAQGRTIGFPAAAGAFEGSATCGLTQPGRPVPRALPRGLARTALRRELAKPSGLSVRCTGATATRRVCRVAFRHRGASYRGSVTLTQRRLGAEWSWIYRIDVRRTRGSTCSGRSGGCPTRVRTETQLGGVLGTRAAAARRLLRLRPGPPAPTRRRAPLSRPRICRIV